MRLGKGTLVGLSILFMVGYVYFDWLRICRGQALRDSWGVGSYFQFNCQLTNIIID